ncbi:MAG TPA: M28 family metallopeptidase [Opitutaceae bacterium]|nr:M28 family metallopeptidase [Opitutaceae bacterium]
MKTKLSALALLLPLAAAASDLAGIRPAVDALSGDRIKQHVAVLASDEFEGRGPGSAGEDKTVAYLRGALAAAGLQPGNPNGSWVQEVPIVGINTKATASITVAGREMPLQHINDIVAFSRRTAPSTTVKDSDVVFVGYGVQAPEYGWDDFKGLDVRGKTVVMLINDPAIPDPKDPAKLDASMFKGNAMTYYGRWTYKYEKAAELGAAACLIVHETIPAAYPWAVVVGSWGRENFGLRSPNGNADKCAVEAWITLETAQKLFGAAGHDFGALKKQALTKDFRPVALNAKAHFTVENTVRDVASRNVLGLLRGSDPKLKDEYIIVSSHWDHLGRDPKREGDQIFNGALDNASGTATVLEMARVLAALPVPPKRSFLFAFVTAEEQGLLGSQYYAQNPLYPPEKTLANLNVDGSNQWGRVSDVEIIGHGNSTIDDLAQRVADAEGLKLIPDTNAEKGFFYRSDHFEFAKVGIPAFYPGNGTTYVGRPAGWGKAKADEFIAADYHKVSDEVKPDWTYDGMVQDGGFLLQVAWLISEGDKWPEWKPGSEFKARRDSMLRPR